MNIRAVNRLFGTVEKSSQRLKFVSPLRLPLAQIFRMSTSPPAPFTGVSDRFRCVQVSSMEETCLDAELGTRLTASLDRWREEGVRGVWFYVHPNQSSWIPTLVKQGFVFHHANEERLALYLWLDKKETCQIPSFAHTLVGVGGMVINDRDEILVVQERFYLAPHWKLPGGYVEPGEEIHQGAIREVFEETGVKTEFRSIVAFRHGHKFNFGCSDIYVIVALKPVSEEINKCNREIKDCRWMPIQEYATHELVHDVNRHFINKYIECRSKGTFIGLTEIQLKIKDFERNQSIYSLHFEN